MNLDELRHYFTSKKGTTEEYPFDDTTLVFKVQGKMFGLTPTTSDDLRMNLKCDPGLASDLRSAYEGILPGYHMNKTHWNTIIANMDVPDEKIYQLIDHSYDLVVAKLPKKVREALNG